MDGAEIILALLGWRRFGLATSAFSRPDQEHELRLASRRRSLAVRLVSETDFVSIGTQSEPFRFTSLFLPFVVLFLHVPIFLVDIVLRSFLHLSRSRPYQAPYIDGSISIDTPADADLNLVDSHVLVLVLNYNGIIILIKRYTFDGSQHRHLATCFPPRRWTLMSCPRCPFTRSVPSTPRCPWLQTRRTAGVIRTKWFAPLALLILPVSPRSHLHNLSSSVPFPRTFSLCTLTKATPGLQNLCKM